jgi:NADH:ubiquinone oxidoreductase subunit H
MFFTILEEEARGFELTEAQRTFGARPQTLKKICSDTLNTCYMKRPYAQEFIDVTLFCCFFFSGFATKFLIAYLLGIEVFIRAGNYFRAVCLVRKKINRQKALEFLRKTWKLRFLPLLRN